ncbi:MAG TPA: ABC transporter permease [Candidatus Limiplasma sp.]|nr:ABC transporter permease [Candidatus Limiplasma sp.]
MKKHRNWTLAALAVCIGILVWSAVEIHAVKSNLQYLIPAPAIETQSTGQSSVPEDPTADSQSADVLPNAEVLALWEALQTTAEDWDGIVESYTLSGIAEGITLSSDADETQQARLNALGEDAFALAPAYLLVGRLFYPEELAVGSDGILLDEDLALALFHITEPVGRTVTVADMEFTVIGILRHQKRVGDSEDYAAYIPLATLWDQPFQLDALQVTAMPVSHAGASATFAADMEGWQAGGTLIDLHKEGMGALLPLRVLLFLIGSVVFFALLHDWISRTHAFLSHTHSQLQVEYASRLWPRLTLSALALLLGYGLLALAAAGLMNYIVAPVYTFPEWVPAVLVEWDDIQSAFWQVWQSAASLLELRSPELIRIRYFGMLTGWFSAGAAVLLTDLWVSRRRRSKARTS